ncbi:hypothetical protein BC828DRAFT_409958 [Blastocladiella britannica]|nr:hypothetical protein BC828DRAFT_409958 [Blastocladiella britannica]
MLSRLVSRSASSPLLRAVPVTRAAVAPHHRSMVVVAEPTTTIVDVKAAPSSASAPPPSPPLPPPLTYKEAMGQLTAGLKAHEATPARKTLLFQLLQAANGAAADSEPVKLGAVESAIRQWRAKGLPVTPAVTSAAVALALKHASPLTALAWVSNAPDTGMSPSRHDLAKVARALLAARTTDGVAAGSLGGSTTEVPTWVAAVGTLSLYDAYSHGVPAADALAAAVHTCLADGSSEAVHAAWALLSDTLPEQESAGTELARIAFHVGEYTGVAAPADAKAAPVALPSAASLVDAVTALERLAAAEADNATSDLPRVVFGGAPPTWAATLLAKLRAEAIASKDIALRDRSRRAFEASLRKKGVAHHAELLRQKATKA